MEAAVDFSYGQAHHLRRLDGIPEGLIITDKDQATIVALNAEHDKLETDYADADDLPDEVDQRLGEIETALLRFEDCPLRFEPADIARAGAFVNLDEDGEPSIDRGFVGPEDEAVAGGPEDANGSEDDSEHGNGTAPATAAAHRAVITTGGEAMPEEDEDNALAPLPERLMAELTAHLTLALRDAVATNPRVALTALLHKLCLNSLLISSSI